MSIEVGIKIVGDAHYSEERTYRLPDSVAGIMYDEFLDVLDKYGEYTIADRGEK